MSVSEGIEMGLNQVLDMCYVIDSLYDEVCEELGKDFEILHSYLLKYQH